MVQSLELLHAPWIAAMKLAGRRSGTLERVMVFAVAARLHIERNYT
jgi:hypothetical protein